MQPPVSTGTAQPTPFPDVNALLLDLLSGVRAILGNHFVGMYLCGSLATGDFDRDSDIDFAVVTDDAISDGLFSALQAMHARLATTDSLWATELEGSYFSQQALRRYDPANALYPCIERGPNEKLRIERHGSDWVIHLHLLREHGIVLAGPPPQTLIDPISADDLRRATVGMLAEWWAPMLGDRTRLQNRGYQSYAVLTMCRALYTLEHGAVASKHAAADWAQATLDRRWAPLIDRAWVGRHHPQSTSQPGDVDETLALIRYALETSCRFPPQLAHGSAPAG